MGEAPGCLMRSLSQPSPTAEFKELFRKSNATRTKKSTACIEVLYTTIKGDPLRALTSSISFGRFMKEPLDWEKWSSFTHNRNIEEVEKYSKPGSVAAKKAYFEAHYKKIAAKKAAAVVEQENEAPNLNPEPYFTNDILDSSIDSDMANKQQDGAHTFPPEQNSTNEILHNSSMASNLAQLNSLEAPRPNTELVSSDNSNGCDMNVAGNGSITIVTELSQTVVEKVFLSHSPTQVIMNAEANISEEVLSDSPIQIVTTVEANKCSTIRTGRSEAVPEEVFSESPVQISLLNQLGSVEKHNEVMAIQEEKMSLKNIDNHGDKVLSTKKKPAIPSSANNRELKLRAPVESSIPVQRREEDTATSNSKKTGRDLTERRRLTTQALHMSINFGSPARVSTKRSSPVLHKIGNSKIAKTFMKPPIERPTRQIPIRASMNGVVSKHSLVLPQQENIRSRVPLDRSVCESRTIIGKSQSLSVGHSESMDARVKKPRPPTASSSFVLRSEERAAKQPRPPTVSSSFVLRSEERAAKRKEFFQKLEEKKANTRETQNIQQQIKTKVPPTRPRSPKLINKPSASTIQDACSRTPRGTYTKTDQSKNFIEKNKQNLTRSTTALPKKKMGENASPNIQF